MIAVDIRGEREAIAGYESMLCALCNEKVCAVIRRIIEDERIHLAALERAQEELCR